MMKRHSIIQQMAAIFLVGILIVGLLTFLLVQHRTSRSIEAQVESIANNITEEAVQAITEFPGYEFLLEYWYRHAGELEIEYDATYEDAPKTELQSQIWNKRHPDLPLEYIDSRKIRKMSADDQRIYAEIMYSWIITRLDQIKQASEASYIFLILSDDTFERQFYLMSAANPGDERGQEYEQVYTLGTDKEAADTVQESMRLAKQNKQSLTDAGSYVDYYTYLGEVADKHAFVGVTYSQEGLAESKMRETLRDALAAGLYEVIMAAACLLLLLYVVIRPLRKVQENIREYKNTKNSAKIIENLSEIRSRNEIGELSEDVSTMVAELDDYMDRIQEFAAENERIGAELNLASRIQLAMLPMIFPPFPEHEELDIYATMIPAKEVGGDFYDFIMVDDTHLALVMADVSGKGVPAALFMTITKVLLQNELLSGKTPSEVLQTINERLCRNNSEEMFVTVWLGIVDLETGEVTCSNAGHEYPFVKAPDGHFEMLKDKHGFVLGGMPGMKYTDYTIKLEPGAKLFVYTDGVPEAERADREQFGLERTLTVLRRFEDLPPQSIVTGMSTAVYDFVGDIPQFDDLTMLVLHYKGFSPNGQN